MTAYDDYQVKIKKIKNFNARSIITKPQDAVKNQYVLEFWDKEDLVIEDMNKIVIVKISPINFRDKLMNYIK